MTLCGRNAEREAEQLRLEAELFRPKPVAPQGSGRAGRATRSMERLSPSKTLGAYDLARACGAMRASGSGLSFLDEEVHNEILLACEAADLKRKR